MKKYLQILVVLALALAIVGIAGNNSAWAGSWFAPARSSQNAGLNPAGLKFAQPYSIIVTGSGSYLVGGICKVDVEFTPVKVDDLGENQIPVDILAALIEFGIVTE